MNLLSGLVVGLLIILIAGYGLTTLIRRSSKPLNAIEHVCHAWLLGGGVVSLILWCGGFYLSGLALKSMVTTSCLFLGLAGWMSGRARGIRYTWPLPNGRVEWLLLAVLVLEIVAAFFLSLGRPLGWDGLFNWETKARFAFLNDGVMPAIYYSGSSQTNSHPEYPLLIPWTQLWLYLWMGVAHQFWVKIIFPLYYAAGAILLAIIGSRISGRRWVGGLIAALLFFGPYMVNGVGGALSGYADLPLGVLYLAAIGYLLLFQRTGDANCLRLSAAAFTLLPWLKREGAILWSVAAFCMVLIIFTQRRRKILLAALLPGLVIIVGWHLQLKAIGVAPSRDFVPATFATLSRNIERTWLICRTVLHELVQTDRWSVFWLLVLAAFIYRLGQVRDLTLLLLSTAVIAPIAAYSCTYFFSSWPDLGAHIQTSFPRLLLHVTPLSWLAIALVLPRARARNAARNATPYQVSAIINASATARSAPEPVTS